MGDALFVGVAEKLLERGLVERNAHGLFVTTRGFLEYAGLRDVADLAPLAEPAD